MFNMLAWQPSKVIELVTDEWWNNCFLFLANGMGVPSYEIIRVVPGGDQQLSLRLANAVRDA